MEPVHDSVVTGSVVVVFAGFPDRRLIDCCKGDSRPDLAGIEGSPSIPGSGSCRIAFSASSFTSVAERQPSSCGILNTFTQPDIFLMRATF